MTGRGRRWSRGSTSTPLVALPARERIGRLKYAAEDEAADEFARAMAQLEEEIAGAASEEEPN